MMGGCADTGCRSMSESAMRTNPCAEGRIGDELPGRDHACDQLGIPASLMRRRRERGWREGRRCESYSGFKGKWMGKVAEEETGMRG